MIIDPVLGQISTWGPCVATQGRGGGRGRAVTDGREEGTEEGMRRGETEGYMQVCQCEAWEIFKFGFEDWFSNIRYG